MNSQGTGKIKNALPAWMRNRRITCGSVTRQFAPIAWHQAYNLLPSDAASRGRLLCARRCG
jgi:hypothetical protein